MLNESGKYCGFNKFAVDTFDFPCRENGWLALEDQIVTRYDPEDGEFETYSNQMRKINKSMILNGICNKNAVLFTEDKRADFSEYAYWKRYETEDNGGIGFVIFINRLNHHIHVYGITDEYLCGDKMRSAYNRLIGKYDPLEFFIGKSDLNKNDRL